MAWARWISIITRVPCDLPPTGGRILQTPIVPLRPVSRQHRRQRQVAGLLIIFAVNTMQTARWMVR